MTEAMMVKRIGELEHTLADLIQVNKTMEERLDKHGARLYTLKQLDIPQQVSIAVSEVVTDAVDWAMQAPLRNRFRDLPKADMKEILHQRMWQSDSYKSHEDHMQLFEALEKSINRDHSVELVNDLAEARKKRKKGRESPKTPPGYQASPTKKHLEALKQVFWYLRGTINWGLWYLKDTTMALTAYTDADHKGCQDTQRSTS
nr:copia protein [Tanacetum cinerariifolium]